MAHKAHTAQPSSAMRSPGEPGRPVSNCSPNVAMKIAGLKLKRVEASPWKFSNTPSDAGQKPS